MAVDGRMRFSEGDPNRTMVFGWHDVSSKHEDESDGLFGPDSLDAIDRAIIQGLIDGRTIEEIMPAVKLERSAVYRRIELMRTRFNVGSTYQLIAVLVYVGLVVPTMKPRTRPMKHAGNRIYSTVRAMTATERAPV